MPVGDNQHTFTCARCSARKPRGEGCVTSGLCSMCCRTGNNCRAACDGCGMYHFSCARVGTHDIAERCAVCSRHKCTNVQCQPATPDRLAGLGWVYVCHCRKCPTCGIEQRETAFYRYGNDRACRECHVHTTGCQNESGHCRACGSPTEGNPIQTECCGFCQGCCVASCSGGSSVTHFEMPMIDDEVFGRAPKKQLSGHGQFRFNPIKRTIGLEIECTKYKSGKRIAKAVQALGGAIVADGSVGSAGFEINTPPLNGDKLVHGMAYLSQVLIDSGARAGPKAGLHIHVDCSDMEYDDMRRMIMLYGRLESGLFSVIDSRRLTQSYSKPNGGRSLLTLLSDPTNARKDIIKMVYTRPPTKGWEAWTKGKACDGDRYWAMNVHSWFLRGTVEFRLHHGTVQWEKMIGFAMLLGAIADGALSIPEREIVEFPQGKEGLLRIAPTDWCRQWVNDRWNHFAKNRKNKNEPIADF